MIADDDPNERAKSLTSQFDEARRACAAAGVECVDPRPGALG
ncbi:hypothetical protein [Saccharothrix obliqua]|nr:hypothetical protein [Saccharothrix obliqua]